jgi:transposase
VPEFGTIGATAAKPKGGDRRSHHIEAYRHIIFGAIEAQVDITLVELAELLQREHGVAFAAVWRLLDRHGITFKKPRTPASRSPDAAYRGLRRMTGAKPHA